MGVIAGGWPEGEWRFVAVVSALLSNAMHTLLLLVQHFTPAISGCVQIPTPVSEKASDTA